MTDVRLPNTKEVLTLMLSLGESAGLAAADGELMLADALYFWDCLGKIVPAVRDLDQVPKELAGITDADMLELIELAADFDIPQDDIEAIIEDFIKVAVPFVNFLAKFQRG